VASGSGLRKARGEGAAPAVFVVLAAVATIFFLLPLAGLIVHAPWSKAEEQLTSAGVLDALRLSLLVSFSSLALSFTFGLPLAWLMSRKSFPGRRLLRGLILVPMVLPPVVGGVGLLTAFARFGLLGDLLARAHITLPFTPAGAVVAATFVSAPFLIVVLEGGFASVDHNLEAAAATLGASRWRILRTVTLPAMWPALSAGAALCWARALGEFGATITFNGNIAGRTQTLPLDVYQTLQTNFDGAIMLSLLLLAVALVVLISLRGNLRVQ
jgi:molybdate transport system permease protein